MAQDERNLLAVLKFELAFLEHGGYREGARSWRPPLIFEDSPTCLNFNDPTHARPCGDCFLSQLAPRESRFKPVPCRYISLNEKGETADSLYGYGTQQELEDAVRSWLRATIGRIEAFAQTLAAAGRKRVA
jgi:hypothetical protein